MAGYIELFNLGKTYETPHGPSVIVEEFNLTMNKGEFVALLGHSGCGKSTVLTMVAGLNSISMGGVVVAGREIMGPGPDRGVVFQSPCLLPWMSAYDNVLCICLAAERAGSTGSRAIRDTLAAVSGNGGAPIVAVDAAGVAEALSRVRAGADIDYQGLSCSMDLTPEGDLATGSFQVYEVQNGAINIIGEMPVGDAGMRPGD